MPRFTPRSRRTWAGPSTVVLSLVVTSAHAITLYTPRVIVNNDQRPRVEVTNVGTKETAVAVSCKGATGNEVVPTINTCLDFPTLAAGNSCTVSYGAGASVFCMVESSSNKVRAVINVSSLLDSTLVTVVPATK